MNAVEKLALQCGFTLPGCPTKVELDALADIKSNLDADVYDIDPFEHARLMRTLTILEKLKRDRPDSD